MSYTAEERETSINCNDSEFLWSIYTLQPRVISKLRKAGIEPTSISSEGEHYYRDIPFNQVSFRSASTRKMSDENKMKAAERLRAAREAKKQ